MRRLLICAFAAIAAASTVGPVVSAADHVLTVDDVDYTYTHTAGPTIHWETSDGDPQVATYLPRNQEWVPGENGSEHLPCEFGIHWISNENVLTISHCLPNPNATTTTTPYDTTTTIEETTTSSTQPTDTTSSSTSTPATSPTTTTPDTSSPSSFAPTTTAPAASPTSVSTGTAPVPTVTEPNSPDIVTPQPGPTTTVTPTGTTPLPATGGGMSPETRKDTIMLAFALLSIGAIVVWAVRRPS